VSIFDQSNLSPEMLSSSASGRSIEELLEQEKKGLTYFFHHKIFQEKQEWSSGVRKTEQIYSLI
jgi:hypothetical protein